MYALKFDMDRLFACLNDMGGFLDSNVTHTHFIPSSYHHVNNNPYFSYVLVDMLMIPNFIFVFDSRYNYLAKYQILISSLSSSSHEATFGRLNI